jgi:lipopolysaccharide/colanic/teichoic acid biosynthesis glycosyltransferase
VKRFFDIVISAIALLLLWPVLAAFCVAIWLQDFRSPLYIAERIGQGGRPFRMVKLRSMQVGADRTGVDSASTNDVRITPVGRVLRAYKIDEIAQFWNVLIGNMSIVGPRPNVQREVALFTDVEREILTVKPGITDLSSIVFADEGHILEGASDSDLAYNQLIRPWKSRLALTYVRHASVQLDCELVGLTALGLLSRSSALHGVQRILRRLGVDERIRSVAMRAEPLVPFPPPGSTRIVTHRDHVSGAMEGA